MKKSIVLLLVLMAVSCQKKETEPVAKPIEKTLKTADLYAKVFYISSKLNPETCEAYNEGCDCCEGKIAFLKNGTFVSSFYCIPDDSYNTGTFKVENNKLMLHYSTKEAVYGPAKDDFAEEEESVWRVDTIPAATFALEILKCHEKYVFKGTSDYYTEDQKTSFSEAVKDFKNLEVWKLLDIKE